jgi:hypothetical protein
MNNPMGLKLKLKYLRVENSIDDPGRVPAQPVLALLKDNKTPSKLVPIKQLVDFDKCIGCIAHMDDFNNKRVDCFMLPDCEGVVYVHANPTNLLRHIEWRLENDK